MIYDYQRHYLRLLWTDHTSPVHTNNPGCAWHFYARVTNNPRG